MKYLVIVASVYCAFSVFFLTIQEKFLEAGIYLIALFLAAQWWKKHES